MTVLLRESNYVEDNEGNSVFVGPAPTEVRETPMEQADREAPYQFNTGTLYLPTRWEIHNVRTCAICGVMVSSTIRNDACVECRTTETMFLDKFPELVGIDIRQWMKWVIDGSLDKARHDMPILEFRYPVPNQPPQNSHEGLPDKECGGCMWNGSSKWSFIEPRPPISKPQNSDIDNEEDDEIEDDIYYIYLDDLDLSPLGEYIYYDCHGGEWDEEVAEHDGEDGYRDGLDEDEWEYVESELMSHYDSHPNRNNCDECSAYLTH